MATSHDSSQKLTLEAVKKVAQLSRLKLSADELASIQSELSAVLENFEAISQVKTDGLQPLVTPTDIEQVLRKDQVAAFDSEKLLVNAPEVSGRLYKVPPVV